MTYVIKNSDGASYTLGQFKNTHRHLAYAEDVPPKALLDHIGYTMEKVVPEKVAPTAKDVQKLMGQKLEALAAGYEPQERETWATQVKEAEAIKAGSTTAPLLSSLAAGKGRTLDEQADRVLYLAEQFALASGAIMAARDALIALDPIPADYAADTYWP